MNELKVYTDKGGLVFIHRGKMLMLTSSDLKGLISPNTLNSKILRSYQNGNWSTVIFEDGSKVRAVVDPSLGMSTKFPDAADICITSFCDNKCPICYNSSNLMGIPCKFQDFKKIIENYQGGEIAIGGGNPFTHPNLIEMLRCCKEKNILPSITINLNHIQFYERTIEELLKAKLIYGVGISYVNSEMNQDKIDIIKNLNNINNQIVIHIVNGDFDEVKMKGLENLSKYTNLKILILGYKSLGRGKNISEKLEIEKENMKNIYLSKIDNISEVVSADTLAAEQLDLKNSIKDWNHRYQGYEGSCSMYIDLVNKIYSRSSIEVEKVYSLNNEYNINNLFKVTKKDN